MKPLVALLLFVATPTCAQDLANQASQQASSPQSAWSANLAPGMRSDFSQRFVTAPEAPRCPPGQVEQRPALSVGQPLTGPVDVTCIPAPMTPAQAALEVTTGKTPAAGSELKSDGLKAR